MDTRPPGDELDPQAAPRPGEPLAAASPPPQWPGAPQAQYSQAVMVPVKGAVVVDGVVMVPAGFAPRFWAHLLDMVVLGILVKIFVTLAGVHQPDPDQAMNAMRQFFHTFDPKPLQSFQPDTWVTFMTYVLYGAYYTLFHAYNGASLGKMAFGLQVRTREGQPLSLSLAFARYLGYWATMLVLYTCWLIPIDREKRTAYDALLKLNVFKPVGRVN